MRAINRREQASHFAHWLSYNAFLPLLPGTPRYPLREARSQESTTSALKLNRGLHGREVCQPQ